MKKSFVVAGLLLVLAAGCAHSTMRGTIAMKTGEREGHVCMSKDEVKAGDRVRVFKNVCPAGKRGPNETCTKQVLGEGTVTKNLNDHYAEVQFDEGVKFDEGTFVEKK